MQTFLPLPSISGSLRCLDDKRLGKQRVEAYQILRILNGMSPKRGNKIGYGNHPAVKMWEGNEQALVYYGVWACEIWKSRGFEDNTQVKILEMYPKLHYLSDLNNVSIRAHVDMHRIDVKSGASLYPVKLPWFIGFDKFHESHRSHLLTKDPIFYGQYEWTEEQGLPLVWPEAKCD